MKTKAVHWIGGVTYARGQMLDGWPCCCSGARCRKIAAEGNVTRDPNAVTCRRCLMLMGKDKSIGIARDLGVSWATIQRATGGPR